MSDSSAAPSSTRAANRSPQSESPFIATPRTVSDPDSDSDDLEVHAIGGGDDNDGGDKYELQQLAIKRADYGDEASEDGRLLSEKSDDDGADDEVIFKVDSDADDNIVESARRRVRRQRRRRRTDFLYTRQEERAVVRKLDKHVVGGMAVLYMLRYVVCAEKKEKPAKGLQMILAF